MRIAIRIFAGLALSAGTAAAIAQAPAPKAGPAAPAKGPSAPAAKAAPRVYYESYQASQRQRLRRESCMRDEDMLAQYCVKRCKPGFVTINADATPRQCRSEKPLPEGQLPGAMGMQQNPTPAPPRPAKAVPGA